MVVALFGLAQDSKPGMLRSLIRAMSKYQPVIQEAGEIAGESPSQQRADQAHSLFQVSRWLKGYVLFVVFYIGLMVAALVWALLGPKLPGGRQVLRTGELRVDQLYSGLALSVLLAPAGVVVRKISTEFALFYPFSIASRRRLSPADLDRISTNGVLALPTIFKYAPICAIMQAILLLVGMLLVPTGTLVLTTAPYAPRLNHVGVVGLPTVSDNQMNLWRDMGIPSNTSDDTVYGVFDFFLETVVTPVQGEIVLQNGVLKEVSSTLGPTTTANISFETGMEYEGVVIYNWNARCEPSLSDIHYNVSDPGVPNENSPLSSILGENITFTFPDGTFATMQVGELPKTLLWTNATTWVGNISSSIVPSNTTVPSGGSLMFISTGTLDTLGTYTPHSPNLAFTRLSWISCVTCTPRLPWEVGSCVWNGTEMVGCVSKPGSNSTGLDVVGLNALEGFMTSVPWTMTLAPATAFGLDLIDLSLCNWLDNNATELLSFRAPIVDDYDKLFGVIAQAMVMLVSGGYYGVAEVPTSGAPLRPVYVVRMYILGLILAMMIAVLVASVVHLLLGVRQDVAFRPATFMGIATSVRGAWWDQLLYGRSTLHDKDLDRLGKVTVMFGVDPARLDHIGLAPKVLAIDKVTIIGEDSELRRFSAKKPGDSSTRQP